MALSELSLSGFEAAIKSNVIDMTALKKADPIKTREEIKSDWLQQRLGKFTASEFHRLMAYPSKAEMPVGGITYVMEKVAESLVEPAASEGFASYDMQWGIDHEAEAVQAFTDKTGLNVDKHGLAQELITMSEHVGCTPDGLIDSTHGLELKCPKSVTHISYWKIKNSDDLKKHCSNYYWQVQGSMMVTGREEWYFASFDPRFVNPAHRLHIAKIAINIEDVVSLSNRLKMAIALKKKLIASFN